MIKSFKHRGLERYFTRVSKSWVPPELASRIRLMPGRLHASENAQNMSLPGLVLHELKGNRKGSLCSSRRQRTDRVRAVNSMRWVRLAYFDDPTKVSISGINCAISFFAAFSFPSEALVLIFSRILSPSEDRTS